MQFCALAIPRQTKLIELGTYFSSLIFAAWFYLFFVCRQRIVQFHGVSLNVQFWPAALIAGTRQFRDWQQLSMRPCLQFTRRISSPL